MGTHARARTQKLKDMEDPMAGVPTDEGESAEAPVRTGKMGKKDKARKRSSSRSASDSDSTSRRHKRKKSKGEKKDKKKSKKQQKDREGMGHASLPPAHKTSQVHDCTATKDAKASACAAGDAARHLADTRTTTERTEARRPPRAHMHAKHTHAKHAHASTRTCA